MSLDNLVGISLDKIDPDVAVIKRLISAAERNIKVVSKWAGSTLY